MFFYLSNYILDMVARTGFKPYASPLRLFSYITFRSAGAAVTALLLSWWMYPRFIPWLLKVKFGQEYVDRAHQGTEQPAGVAGKRGTPTMGGLLIVLTIDVTAMLWAQWNTQILLTLLTARTATASANSSSCGPRADWPFSPPPICGACPPPPR
jgi:phospho-N-acetylmuramoyl-pentapeptide-transferase